MSLNDLFTVTPTVRLTPDINSWGDQIVAALLNRYSALSKMVGEVVFNKVEPIKGNSIGHISLIGKTQRIPFIVDEYELNPLDIYIDNGMYLPLTEKSVIRLEKREWPFRLISQLERNSIIKTASLFDDTGSLKNDFIQKHQSELRQIAESCPDVIEKVANQTIPEKPEVEVAVRYFVKEAASNKPLVARDLTGPDKEYKVSEIADLFGKDFVTKLMTDKEIYVCNMTPSQKLMLDKKELQNNYKPTQHRVGVINQDGNFVQAKKFDHYKISNLAKASSNIVITKNGQFLPYNQSLLETPSGESPDNMRVESENPRNGDYAGFIFGDCFYGPFYIKTISNVNGLRLYTILDDQLETSVIRVSKDIKSLVQLDKNSYLVSENANLVKIIPATEYEKKMSVENFIKTAAIKVNINKQTNGKFIINDANISGIASNKLSNLDKGDAVLVLRKCGLSEIDAKYALMKATSDGSYSFDAPSMNKTAATVEPDENLVKCAESIVSLCDKSGLLKMAVISGDKSNIDLALGLNLLSYANLKRFKLLVPDIYTMLDKLCKLLVMKRMNRSLVQLDEGELTKAVFALDEIAASLGSF